MPTLQELREKRMKLVTDARSVMEGAKAAGRDMNAEESQRFDTMMSDSDKIKKEIEDGEKAERRSAALAEAERELNASRGRRTESDQPRNQPSEDRGNDGYARKDRDFSFRHERRNVVRGRERVEAFDLSFRAGTAAHTRHTKEVREAFRKYLRHGGDEYRAMQTDQDTAGGYLTVPEQFVAELIKDVDDQVFIRQYARKFTTNAQTLGAPRRTNRMSAFAWGSELSAPAQDTALKFGKRALAPHYMTGEILVSRDLMRAAIMDPEQIVRDEIARDAGELEERAFISGTGAQQPLGLFTASNDGISTSRDVSSGNTTTSIAVDGLISAKFALKQKYRATAMWMFHRDAVAQIRKLKDSTNQYLWQPSTVAGEPDRILNLPFVESEWIPNTFTTGLYVGLIGDLSYYWIADGLDFGMQRLIEKYAENNQDAFLVRRKVDGAPILEEAFARVKLA